MQNLKQFELLNLKKIDMLKYSFYIKGFIKKVIFIFNE